MIPFRYISINMHTKVWKSFLFFFFIGQGLLLAKPPLPTDGNPDYCLDKAYPSAIGETKESIDGVREEDLNYSIFSAGKCCCSSQIKGLFKEKTKKITHDRVNPAVDLLIQSLRNQRMASDIKIEELVHLKYVLAIYSFYNEDGKEMSNKELSMPANDDDGCKPVITFLKPKDLNRKGVYREGILKEMLAMLHAWKKSDKIIAEKNMIKLVQ